MRALAGIVVLVVALIADIGCSDVTVTGKLGDRTLNVAGTGLGWIDATEFVDDTGSLGTPVLQDRSADAVTLHLLFTEAVFDPRVDLRTLPAGERDAILSDIVRGDRLFVDVARGNVIRPGDKHIELVQNDGSLPPEVLPFITQVSVLLGDPVIAANERYPDRASRVGSKLSARLEVTETSPELVADLKVSAHKADNEKDGFLEGDIAVHFGFELLPERLAECNFARTDAGVVDPCTLQ